MILLADGLQALKRVAKRTGLEREGSSLQLEGGFDAKHQRQVIFKAGMIPPITENPRHRNTTKRGRQRLCNAAMPALRDRVARMFAWADKFTRWLRRFEHIQQRHDGMKVRAYTWINLRCFCAT
jgi:hypothetical protein